MRARNWTVTAAVVVAAATVTAGAAATPVGNFYGVCGTLSAKGKTYVVRTVNVPCKAGRAVIAKLANMPDPGANKRFPGTYSGMGCMHLVRGKGSLFCTTLSPFRQIVGVG